MKKTLLSTILVLSILALPTACNTGSAVTTDPDEDLQADAGTDAAPADLLPQDGAADAAEDAAPPEDLAPVDTIPTCEPGTGCFGEPCAENSECLSGWCVDHLGGAACTESCQEDCPPGWSCEQVSGGGRDLVFICVSLVPSLCLPCWNSGDCAGPGDVQVPCVLLDGEGSFCGGACDADDACPEGSTCQEATTVEGVTLAQCMPDAGICPCTDKAVEAGLTTPCALENDDGRCEGIRACTEGGLGACDATEPGAEICNDVDDDCDGDVDEDTCDDENPCTDDVCTGAAGCEHLPLDGVECPDGDLCTGSDLCIQGICVGEPKDCDDGNPCTDDWCDPETGLCENVDNAADCDDGDPCTVADECGDGACAGTPVACDCVDDADCDKLEDGDVCNGTLFCDTSSVPFLCEVAPDTAIDCQDPTGPDAPCLEPACDPVTGACGFAEANEGYPCEDGDPCTVADLCEKGECLPGVPVNCNDGNPCTDDSCVPGVGCLNTPNAAPCEDGDICTLGDLCVDGECDHGPQIACDDGNPCTDDACDSAVGCVHVPNAEPCDDGNLCTELGLCVAGTCAPGKAIGCNDGDVCTDDGCDPLVGCVFTPNVIPCDDGNACTVGDTCAGGACQPGAAVGCGDGNPCTDDSCDPMIGCIHGANTDPCNDGNACTEADVCADGQCGGGGGVDCDDGNPCTNDSCDWQTGCVNQENQEPCDDLNACTAGDICGGGVCNPGAAVNCDDEDVCTTDSCVPTTGCVQLPNAAPCDDGDACTAQDVCADGTCAGAITVDCDDGNPCTDDSCHPLLGCAHANNAAPCDDLNTCTTGDTCAGGVCQGTGSLECDDANPCTKDICLPAGGCANEAVSGACDDGDPCTLNDACDAGTCVSGDDIDCDDDNPCTDDSCDDTGECQHAPNDAACDDGNACTTGDHCADGACAYTGNQGCDDANVCTTDWCDPSLGCQSEDNDLPCNDMDACTEGDVCVAGVCTGLGDVACDDGNPCTDDSCDPETGCVHVNNAAPCEDGNLCTLDDQCGGGVCTAGTGKDCDDGDVCTTDSCQPLIGCVYTLNAAPCDDGNACTTVDTCANGVCAGTSVLSCNDGNLCTDDSCNPAIGCVFTNNAVPCDDGNACTTVDVCAGGTCVGSGALGCNDGNVCTDDSCDPDSGCVFSNNVAACNDGNPCTTVDTCVGGACVGAGALACNDGNQCTSDSCQAGQGCVYTPISPCCGNGVTEAGEQCDDGNTSSGDGCSSTCQNESTCGGWQWNGACWYTGGLGQTCTTVCASHCGFDVQGSKHTGNTVGFHFWPGKANGSNWVEIECSSTDNNTNWGANGGTPSGSYSHPHCHLNCACNC